MIRTLYIDLDKKLIKNELIDKKTIEYAVEIHKKVYKTYEKNPYENNITIFSVGHMKNKSEINSLIIYRSPITGSLDINLTSFGRYIKETGNDLIIIKGRSDKKYFLIIENDNVVFLEDNIEEDIFNKEKNLYNTLKDIYGNKDFIILLTGLGSKYTIYGNLIIFENNKIKATKGGIGSVLYNYHNITGLSIGGDNKIEFKGIFVEDNNKIPFHESLKDVYKLALDKLPILNFKNIYIEEQENKKFFENYIYPLIDNLKGNYPYEPFNMLGPFIGIFDEKLIADLLHDVNKYGIDAVYIGYILGLVLEGLYLEKIEIKEFGKSKFDFKDVDSEINYNIAKFLIEKIAYQELSIFGKNIRYIANTLNLQDIAFYIPLGTEYSATINPYISLGLILPNIIYDKYFSDHLMNPMNPKDYASLNFGKLESTLEINNVENKEITIEHDIRRENFILNLFEYIELSNSLPDVSYPKRIIDMYYYISKKYNINYRFEDYFAEYFNKYKELIYYKKAPVV
ncbi:MAG: aldehyde ferredoxin oxidoreductase N-terminal domain-containing protein [Nanopusillaceae archaeon]